MADTFDYPIKEYKWLSAPPIDTVTNGRIVIHRSLKRHNKNYAATINALTEKPIFLTSDIQEYLSFEFKEKCELYLVKTITEMAVAINSCKLFIGNQSSPFAIASALDVNRICEMDAIDYPFYAGEIQYSKKLNLILP